MQQYLQNQKGLVQSVFDRVYDKYDLMNDFMSMGVHRIWKRNLINMMNPSLKSNLIWQELGKQCGIMCCPQNIKFSAAIILAEIFNDSGIMSWLVRSPWGASSKINLLIWSLIQSGSRKDICL